MGEISRGRRACQLGVCPNSRTRCQAALGAGLGFPGERVVSEGCHRVAERGKFPVEHRDHTRFALPIGRCHCTGSASAAPARPSRTAHSSRGIRARSRGSKAAVCAAARAGRACSTIKSTSPSTLPDMNPRPPLRRRTVLAAAASLMPSTAWLKTRGNPMNLVAIEEQRRQDIDDAAILPCASGNQRLHTRGPFGDSWCGHEIGRAHV